jgi:hypothetical protein
MCKDDEARGFGATCELLACSEAVSGKSKSRSPGNVVGEDHAIQSMPVNASSSRCNRLTIVPRSGCETKTYMT